MLSEWMKELQMLIKWLEEDITDASRVDEGTAGGGGYYAW